MTSHYETNLILTRPSVIYFDSLKDKSDIHKNKKGHTN
jgi:hypothetical protein